MENSLETILDQLHERKDLTRKQAKWVFDQMMAGDVAELDFKALLTALVDKGESVDELVGAAEAMRAKVIRVNCDAECIDTCGTGGGGISTYNASTSEDRTVYYGWVREGDIGRQIELLADMMRSKLPAEELEMEKKVVLEEIAMSKDQLEHVAYAFIQETGFAGHTLAWLILA